MKTKLINLGAILFLAFSCTNDKVGDYLDLMPELAEAGNCSTVAEQEATISTRSSVSCDVTSVKSGPWASASTWGGSIPTSNDVVCIKDQVSIQPSTTNAVAKKVYVYKGLNTEFGSVLTVGSDFVIEGGQSGSELKVAGNMYLYDDADFKNYSGACGNVHIEGWFKISGKKVKVGGDTDILAENGLYLLDNAKENQIKNVQVVEHCKPLSIKIDTFDASYNPINKTVSFAWTTGEESGVEEFYIEHADECSMVSRKFQKLPGTSVAPKNGETGANTYKVDLLLDPENKSLYKKGKHQFRLKIKDEGKLKVSKTIQLEFKE